MTRHLLFLCAVTFTGVACAQPVGRLFFTPAERTQLDQARSQKQRTPQQAATPEPATLEMPEVVTYSGIVRRSDGKAILWLNNRPAEESEALARLPVSGRVGSDGAVTLRMPQTGGTVQLKVGQRAELQTGRVAETRREAAPVAPHSDSSSRPVPSDEKTERKTESAPAVANSPSSDRTTQAAESSARPGNVK